MAYESERQRAIESVIQAAKLCRAVRSSCDLQRVIGKTDGSPVTVADFGAQALIALHLSEAFPGDVIVGEEQSGALRENQNAAAREAVLNHVRTFHPGLTSDEILDAIDQGAGNSLSKDRFWTVDPIDGTKGFIRGGQYAVALALLEKGRVVLGVLGCPNLPLKSGDTRRGSLFAAVKGEGSRMRAFEDPGEERIYVADTHDPSQAVICESFESSHASHKDNARIAQSLGIKGPPLRMDSQCKYGAVARGEASIYLRITSGQSYIEKTWDHTAGSLIVEEAGGRVTDLDGRSLDFSVGRELFQNRGIIASNGKVHDAVLGAVQSLGV